jgi:hypothetical protein
VASLAKPADPAPWSTSKKNHELLIFTPENQPKPLKITPENQPEPPQWISRIGSHRISACTDKYTQRRKKIKIDECVNAKSERVFKTGTF